MCMLTPKICFKVKTRSFLKKLVSLKMTAKFLEHSCCLLGLLLVSLWVASATLDCRAMTRTVSLVLSNNHILRTWQPDGAHCRWWESRQSETNRFPAAVRSGPRWLVMKLRQPLMLEAMSVQGWDGQWQAAVRNQSPVSVVGASSLPLELQLEHPCRASWATFRSSDRWRQIGIAGDANFQTPVSFLRLSSHSSLSWQSLKITGREPPMEVNMSLSGKYLYRNYGLTVKKKVQSRLTFFVDFCGDIVRPECWLLRVGTRYKATKIVSSVNLATGVSTQKFELKFVENSQDSRLQCGSSTQRTVFLEEPLLWEVPVRALEISVPRVLVIGHVALINVSSDSFPETRHQCDITNLNGQKRDLAPSYQESSIQSYARDRNLIRVRSEFRLTVQADDLNAKISCSGNSGSDVNALETKQILAISEPCKTVAHLGPSPYWLVGKLEFINVTSRNCSSWNVTHRCVLHRLTDDASVSVVPLLKFKEESFSSRHALAVSEAMRLNDWKIVCSVVQSGLAYPDLVIHSSSAPAVVGSADKASIDVSAMRTCNNLLLVQATINQQQDRLPVTNVTCRAVSMSEFQKDIPMQQTDQNTWSSMISTIKLQSLEKFSVHCFASQLHHGELVFHTMVKVEVTTERCLCTNLTHLAYYSVIAAVLLLLIVLIVIVITWRIAQTRLQRSPPTLPPNPRPANLGDCHPYEIPSSDRRTIDDSVAYEQVSDGTCGSSQPTAFLRKLPELPAPRQQQPRGGADGSYINLSRMRQF